MGVARAFGPTRYPLANLIPSCAGDAEENGTTRHYHTVAELSSTDLSDDPAKTDTDDINQGRVTTTAIATQDT